MATKKATRARLFIQATPSTNFIDFDASVNENHSFASQATEHPVENGTDITDHIRRTPDQLTVNVIMSNDPPIVNASTNALPSPTSSDPRSRAQDSVKFLRGLKDTATIVGMTTTLTPYKNLYIQSISVVRNARTGRIADITLTLREILFAQTEDRARPVPTNPSNNETTNNGDTPKKPAGDKTTDKAEELQSGFSKLTGIGG